jgi:hypothetical protein
VSLTWWTGEPIATTGLCMLPVLLYLTALMIQKGYQAFETTRPEAVHGSGASSYSNLDIDEHIQLAGLACSKSSTAIGDHYAQAKQRCRDRYFRHVASRNERS